MFVGHLAVALGARAAEPKVPLGTAVAAAFALDLLWPVLLLLGLESVEVHPADTAFTNLAFVSYPWSHSLALVALWSVLACLSARSRLGPRAAAVVGLLVASHWALDFLTHRPDLPLWPGGPQVGARLWDSIAGTIFVEGGLLVAGVAAYVRATTARDAVGRWAFLSLVGLATIIWITQPWSPPPPSSTAVAVGALALWLFPPWAHWIDRHRH